MARIVDAGTQHWAAGGWEEAIEIEVSSSHRHRRFDGARSPGPCFLRGARRDVDEIRKIKGL